MLLLLFLVATVLSVYGEDIPKVRTDFCIGKQTGFYGFGCSPYFAVCIGPAVELRRCRRNMYFDEATTTCLPKLKVEECKLMIKSAVALKPIHPEFFTCEGKVDGVYKQECSGLFVLCNDEKATFLRCPKGLLYDGETAKCAKKVSGCKPLPLAPAPIKEKEEAGLAFSCKKVSDGLYANPIDAFIVKCSKGKALLISCPQSMTFIPKRMECVETSLIRSKRFVYPYASGAMASDMVAGYDAYGGFFDISTAVVATVPSPLPYFPTCVGLSYGVHSFGCAGDYLIALPDFCSISVCPVGLIYDITLQKCAPQEKVKACVVVPKTTKPPKPAKVVVAVGSNKWRKLEEEVQV